MKSDKNRFHDYSHAVDYNRRAGKSNMRSHLTPKLIQALDLKGSEWVLDLATGTGRFGRPVAQRLKNGKIVGLDEALAMLRVGRHEEKKEPIPGFATVAGTAEAFPFRANVFDRVFTAFAFHHFRLPALALHECYRVLKSGGRLVVLDPVLIAPQDALDEKIHRLINRILGHGHGGHFEHHSAQGIQELLIKAGFGRIRIDPHNFAVDQEGTDGIPTGRHWIEIGEEMRKEAPEIRQRFEQNYFRYEKTGETVYVQGSFAFAVVWGVK